MALSLIKNRDENGDELEDHAVKRVNGIRVRGQKGSDLPKISGLVISCCRS